MCRGGVGGGDGRRRAPAWRTWSTARVTAGTGACAPGVARPRGARRGGPRSRRMGERSSDNALKLPPGSRAPGRAAAAAEPAGLYSAVRRGQRTGYCPGVTGGMAAGAAKVSRRVRRRPPAVPAPRGHGLGREAWESDRPRRPRELRRPPASGCTRAARPAPHAAQRHGEAEEDRAADRDGRGWRRWSGAGPVTGATRGAECCLGCGDLPGCRWVARQGAGADSLVEVEDVRR